MRRVLPALVFAFLVPTVAFSDDASDLRDKVLKAAAKDPADLKKLRIHTVKATGISKTTGEPVPATLEIAASWPGQMRLAFEFNAGAMKTGVTLCGSNDRGWRKVMNTPTEDLSIEQLNDVRTDAYAIWVATLTTLGDGDTKLAIANKIKLDSDNLVGLKVTRRPWPEITLYFDGKSSLLRKMSYRGRESGATLAKDIVFDGHKEVNGLMLPTRQSTSIEGKEIFAWATLEYTFPEKLDAKLFEKP